MTSILIVERLPAVRRGLRLLFELEPGLDVVGEAGDAETALERVRELDPDVVLMAVDLPGTDGIAATEKLRDEGLTNPVVILTMYDDTTTLRRARAAGAAAFVSKHHPPEAVIEAVRRADVRGQELGNRE